MGFPRAASTDFFERLDKFHFSAFADHFGRSSLGKRQFCGLVGLLAFSQLAIRFVLHFKNGAEHGRLFVRPHPTRDIDVLFGYCTPILKTSPPMRRLSTSSWRRRRFGPTPSSGDCSGKGFAILTSSMKPSAGSRQSSDRVGSPENEDSHNPYGFRWRPFEAEQIGTGAVGGASVKGCLGSSFGPSCPQRSFSTGRLRRSSIRSV
jgi:hypothetical protein